MLLLHGITGVCVCVCLERESIPERAHWNKRKLVNTTQNTMIIENYERYIIIRLYIIKTIHAEYHAHNKISYQVLGLKREACSLLQIVLYRRLHSSI